MSLERPSDPDHHHGAEPASAIHICIRATLDWNDEAQVAARLLPAFRPKFELWNATLNMPYRLFRVRLKQIACLSFARVAGATLSAVEDVPPGDVIVPTDDDDWFAPDLASHLRREYDPRMIGYLWRRDVIEPPRGFRTGLGWLRNRILGPPPDRVPCKTNNYAIANRPDAVANRPELLLLVRGHLVASDHFNAHVSKVKQIPATLAIQNRNLSSQTSLRYLRPSTGRQQLAAVLERYRNLYSTWHPGPDTAWARPYVDMMADLMHDVRVE